MASPRRTALTASVLLGLALAAGGARLAPIPADHPAYGEINGVLVAGVQRGSPAAAAGLRRGDIILGVDGGAIGSPEELAGALAQSGERFQLNILRGGREIALVVG